MKKVILIVFALMIAAASAGYAASAASEGSASNNGFINGMGKILRLPITMLDKASGDFQDSKKIEASEDVAVADVYDLGAETTG